MSNYRRHHDDLACLGKAAFPSMRVAREVAARPARQSNEKRRRVQAYRCRTCGQYHIGSRR